MEKYVFPTKPKANLKAIISGPKYRFTVLTDRLLRFEWAEDGQFEDRASTFAINRDLPVPEFRIIDNDGLEIITEHFHLSYDKKRFSPNGMVAHLSAKTTKYGTEWRFGTPSTLNLGGTARTLDLCDGRCDMGDGVLSKAGFAVIDDSESMLFDGQGFVASRPAGDRVDGYLFAYGRDYKAAIKAFYAVSGKQPVVPRYALGNWWSRYYPYRQEEYLQLMDRFHDLEIPMSVAVLDMDWHLVSDERVPHAGWTGYTWNKELFPDPALFARELHKRNLKITLNDHPHDGIHSHEDSYEEMAKFLGHDTKHKTPILFDSTDPKFMDAYLNILHRNLEAVACDFWWIDWQQGPYSKIPGIDPLWMLNHFAYLDHGRDGKIPLILSRYAGPGSHRYPLGFSGDTVVTWASLEFQPEFTATASNIGYGWWSHDIGGHIHGGRDDELVTRWVQLGVFSPIMRLHSTSSRWMSKEPWLYRTECGSVMSKFLNFRHRLVPFLYTRNLIGADEDEPLVQPMYWEYPGREEAYSVTNQFFFGSELVVAPIVQPRDKRTNLASVKAWLPPRGLHVDIFTGTVYDGDRALTLYRKLEDYPVLAHEGSIIPLDASSQNGCLNPDAFEVLILVGKDGYTEVLEDSRDNRQQESAGAVERQVSTVRYIQTDGRLTAEVTGRLWTFNFLAFTSVPKSLRVLINGFDRTDDATVWLECYPQRPGLHVKCPSTPNETYYITIELGPSPQVGVIDHIPRLGELIRDYQIEFRMKNMLWDVVEGFQDRPLNVTIGRLTALGYDEAIVGPILELLLADSRSVKV
ncbi:putative alpha-xylosidase [Aspergillus pseudonomiae]|uniref:alpha-glucosidase n=1 Tax=Aspergillus pseudonomiae TaxID=1506151 RepID=A0A5N6IC70_9EURO|nr:putative alpha-xylosidase [Aspergillus pseudonomiae]KAB8264331.1 putative alpha-xylosidase [Aspergillus pseudonomiae]KAE8409181.1 putative alpha-xylosidase [Aspergillus pseudonomiae]